MTDAIQDATPSFVVRLGTTYYAGIGTLWNKPEGADTWTPAVGPALLAGTAFAGSGAVIDVAGTETLFVAFTDSMGTSVWFKTSTSVWSKVESLPTDRYLRMLLTAHDTLFAVTANKRTSVETPENYTIHYLSAGAFVDTTVVANADIGFPNSVASADNGTTFWFTAGDSLLTGSPSALSIHANEPPGGSAYAGVCSTGTDILVSNRLGFLYYSSDSGANWISNASAFTSSTSKAYSFSTPTYFDLDGAKTLVVGTNRIPIGDATPVPKGYLGFDMATPFVTTILPQSGNTALSTADNFDSSLIRQSVNAMPFFIHVDGVTHKLFALTVGDGLWSNTNNGSAWSGWVRE